MKGIPAAVSAPATRNATSSMVIGSLHLSLQLQAFTENLAASCLGSVGELLANAGQGNPTGRFKEPLPSQRFFLGWHRSRFQYFLAIQLIDQPLRLGGRRVRRWFLVQRIWFVIIR